MEIKNLKEKHKWRHAVSLAQVQQS